MGRLWIIMLLVVMLLLVMLLVPLAMLGLGPYLPLLFVKVVVMLVVNLCSYYVTLTVSLFA